MNNLFSNSQRLEDYYKDKEPHLYTLIVRPDNTFTIFVDNKEVNSGSLLEDFTPPVNPPEEIDDPNDKKPEDWDEREKVFHYYYFSQRCTHSLYFLYDF